MHPDDVPDINSADLDALGDRMDGTYTVPILREPIGGPVPAPDPSPDEIRSMATEDDAVRAAAGHDVTPGRDELHHYWTQDPEGLAKWADAPHPYEALLEHLEHHMGPGMAHRVAADWFHDVFHFWPGSDLNRVTHGHPPRGDRVGPG